MTEEEYVKKCEEVLTSLLPVESPDELMKASMEVESLGYLATKYQARSEGRLRAAELDLINAKANVFPNVSGRTAEERKVAVDKLVSDKIAKVEEQESLVKFYRNLSVLIERRVGLAQSMLANFSAQIKAGILSK